MKKTRVYNTLAAAMAAGLVTVQPAGAKTMWGGFYAGAGLGFGGGSSKIEPSGGGFSFDGLGGEGMHGEIIVGYEHLFGARTLGGIELSYRVGNGATTLTDIDNASMSASAGQDQKLSFKLKVFPKTTFVAGGAKLYITANVPVTIRNETLVIEPISAGT